MSFAISCGTLRRVRARCFVLSAAAAAAMVLIPERVNGASKTWVSFNTTGVWSTAGNWSPVGVPANPLPAGDDLTFNGSTSPASTVDAPWTVSTLNFKGNDTRATFTLSGSPLSITGAINSDSRVRPTIQNNLVLVGSDNGRGPEVDFNFILPGNFTGAVVLAGSVTGPARIRIGNGGRVFFNQAPQNTGGPLATLDPGGANYGLLVDSPFGIVGVGTSAPGNLTFFGNSATAIGMTGGFFNVSHGNFSGVTTIPNPLSVFTTGGDIAVFESSSSNLSTQHRVNLTGPTLLKGSLLLARQFSPNANSGVGGIGQDLQGTITVASDNAAIMDFSSSALSDSLISGNITQDGVARRLTLGHDGSLGAIGVLLNPFSGEGQALQLSGDNTGLTGGMRVVGIDNPGSSTGVTRFAYRFLSLASMGGGGNGNVFIGANGTAGIGFALSDAALKKIDPSSTGVIGIDADSSLDIDLSATGRNMPNVKIGSSLRRSAGVHYTGHITPFGSTYMFGAPQSRGTLSLDAADALSGTRGLNVGQGLELILNAAQSLGGPLQIDGSLIVNAAGALNPKAPIALNGALFIGRLDDVVPAQTQNGDITLGAFPGITISKTTGGAGYDLLLNGSLRGGSAQGQLFLGGNGTVVLKGANNDFAGSTVVGGGTTLVVNSSLSASAAPVMLSSFLVGGAGTVVHSGRLGGSGTVLRPVTTDLFSSGTLAPGGYPSPTGTLTIDSLQVNGITAPITYEFQFDEGSNDFLKILHDFENPAGGTAILKLLPLAGDDGLSRTIPFLDVDGAVPNPIAWTVDTSLAPQYAGSFVTFDPASEVYSVTLAPEPGGIGLLLALPLLWRRRRTRRLA